VGVEVINLLQFYAYFSYGLLLIIHLLYKLLFAFEVAISLKNNIDFQIISDILLETSSILELH